jgi:hypothetical protein
MRRGIGQGGGCVDDPGAIEAEGDRGSIVGSEAEQPLAVDGNDTSR